MIWWLTRDHKEIAMSQKELNELYELPSMDISFKYSFLVKSIAMTLFYLPIFPLGVVIILFGLVFAYCLERFNFTKLYKRPEMLNDKICLFYVQYFAVILFAYGVGNWIFLSDLFASKAFAYINIIFFGLMVLFPYLILTKLNLLRINESEVNLKTYDDVYFKFSNDYERMNPMTKTKGMKDYLFNLRKNNLISQEALDYAIDNLSKVNLLEMYYKSTLYQDNFQIGNQMMKTCSLLNPTLAYGYNCIMKSDNVNNQQMLQNRQNQVDCPFDQQIMRNFTFCNPMMIHQVNSLQNNVNVKFGDNYQSQGYYCINPIFNPFMSHIMFNNGYESSSNNQQQSLPYVDPHPQLQPQLSQPYLDNDGMQSNILISNGPLNYNNNSNNNGINQGYNSHDMQIAPNNYSTSNVLNAMDYQSNIPQNNSSQSEQYAYNPFSIMNNNPMLHKKQKEKDILKNTYRNIGDDTPGNPNTQVLLQNYNLGPVIDQPYSSLQEGSQRLLKANLDPIIESKLDSDDIALSFQLQNQNKKEDDSVIDNIGD